MRCSVSQTLYLIPVIIWFIWVIYISSNITEMKIRMAMIEKRLNILYSKSIQFDVTYSNMDRNGRRKEHMERLFDFMGLASHRRFRAVDGLSLYRNASYLKAFKHSRNISFDLEQQKANKNGSAAITAIWLTHLLMLKDYASWYSSRPMIIFEDDVDLEVDFVKLVEDSTKFAPSDWEILLFGYCCMRPKNTTSLVDNDLWTRVNYFAMTHCFMVKNSTIAAKIARLIDQPIFNSGIDIFLNTLIDQNQIIVYAHHRPIAVQRRDLFKSENPKSSKAIPKQALQVSAVDLMRNFQ